LFLSQRPILDLPSLLLRAGSPVANESFEATSDFWQRHASVSRRFSSGSGGVFFCGGPCGRSHPFPFFLSDTDGVGPPSLSPQAVGRSPLTRWCKTIQLGPVNPFPSCFSSLYRPGLLPLLLAGRLSFPCCSGDFPCSSA